MKRVAVLALLLAVFMCLTSCHDITSSNSHDATDSDSRNVIQPVYNKAHERIGEIEHFGFLACAQGSIIYGKFADDSVEDDNVMDYYRYDVATQEHIKLGRVTGWTLQSAQTAYVEGHLFLLVCTGNITDNESRMLKLLDVDLTRNTLSEVFSEPGGSPADTMAVAGDRLLIARNFLDETRVEEYDVTSNRRTVVAQFDFDNEALLGEAIRQIAADESTVSLLMLVKETSAVAQLRVDVYDHKMNPLRSVDVTALSSDQNELIQGVQHFEYTGQSLYYENYSITRFLGETGNDHITQLLETGPVFYMANDMTSVSRGRLFYQGYCQDDNALYFWDMDSGTIAETSFYADDTRYYITNASRDSSGTVLIQMGGREPLSDDKLESRLYYLTMEELGFDEIS